MSIATDYLASLQGENALYGSSWGPSVDLTGWVLEMLSLVDASKYQTNIDLILKYLSEESMDENGNYLDVDSGFGVEPNANTQGSVLLGLMAYDKDGLVAGKYNRDDYNPYDALLKFQNEDGSFYSSYSGVGNYDQYATMQGVQALGHYENGSVLDYAKGVYSAFEDTPKVDETEKEPVKDNTNSDIVVTGDESSVYVYALLLVGALAVIVYERKTSY